MQSSLIELVKKSFQNNLIDGAIALVKRDDGYNYLFFTSVEDVKDFSLFHPVMKMNGATILSSIMKENDADKKILAIMKPCEVRAAVELKKLNQIDLKNIILISYICPGVLEFKEGNNFSDSDEFFTEFLNGNINDDIRPVCKCCSKFSGEGSDIVYNVFDNSFVALTARGEEFLNNSELSFKTSLESNENLEKIKEVREKNSKDLIKEKRAFFKSEEKIIEYFDKCIGCHACSHACPICYCRQCYFESETFKYYPDSIKRKLEYKGAIRLPMDRIMFHLGRVTHMAVSCVSCGMCEDVCPVDIKVSQFFKYMGSNIQEVFNYIPGINREEALPLLTFKENEFSEVED